MILGFCALILTFSRSAWIAFCLFTTALLLINYKQIINIKLLVGLVVLVGLSIPYFQTLTANSESVFVRNELNSAALSMWKTSPIIGIGLGNYVVNLPTYYPHRDIFFLQPVHNIYLLILSETGVIGLGVFIFFLWKIFKKSHKTDFSLYIFISLSLYLLLGFVDHYSLTLQQGQLLLTILISFSFL